MGKVLMIDPRIIKPIKGYNVRPPFNPANDVDDAALVDSIAKYCVRVPVTVRQTGNDIFLVLGYRRYEAVMHLIANGMDIRTIPVVLLEPFRVTDEEIARLLENDDKDA